METMIYLFTSCFILDETFINWITTVKILINFNVSFMIN